LSVHARASAALGTPLAANQWTVLDCSLREVDTHLAITPGPGWRWTAPMRGVFQLLATVRLDPGFEPGTPLAWQLRVLRGAQLVAEVSFSAAASGQVAWLGLLEGQDVLQVQLRPTTAVVLATDPLGLSAVVSIAGVGVAL
jgi:hypothetical protein